MRFAILSVVGAVLASSINAAELQNPRELVSEPCNVDYSLLDTPASVEIWISVQKQPQGAASVSTFALNFFQPPPWGTMSTNVLAWCVDTERILENGGYSVDIVNHVTASEIDSSHLVDSSLFLKGINWFVNHGPEVGEYILLCDEYLTFDEIQYAIWQVTDAAVNPELYDNNGAVYQVNGCVESFLASLMEAHADYETDCLNENEVVGVIMSIDAPGSTTITHQVIFAEIPVSDTNICDCGGGGGGQNGGSGGDPHFKTWTGDRYDFHGICDMILLKNPDFPAYEHDVGVQQNLHEHQAGMDIHIRTAKTKQWSYITAAVLRIGEETFEVTTEEGDEPKYFLNQVEGDDLSKGLIGFSISSMKKSRFQIDFVVDLGTSGTITLKSFKKMIRVDVHALSDDAFGSSLGLMGKYGSGRWMARDRTTVMDDAIEFGMEWQVLPEEPMMFHKVAGPQAPDKCEVPSASASRRRLLDSSITLDEARIACSRVNDDERDMCIFDVLAMDDKDVAGSY